VPEEVVAARHTPEDKPFNYEHVESDIIGHITSVTARDKDGNEIPADSPVEDYPAQFDLHTGAVLYAHWADEKLMERMDGLIAGIKDGKWHVSMECLFRDFDYALLEADGTQKIVARNKATAFLTKKLKTFGGDGTYGDAKLGIVPRPSCSAAWGWWRPRPTPTRSSTRTPPPPVFTPPVRPRVISL
jgi:hypothetical protein